MANANASNVTYARYNAKSMVLEHTHAGVNGWHWPSARHPKAPNAHVECNAANPVWATGTMLPASGPNAATNAAANKALKATYTAQLNRQEGAVNHIAQTHPHLARFAKAAPAQG